MAEWWESAPLADQQQATNEDWWSSAPLADEPAPVESPWYQQLGSAADDLARIAANSLTFGYADKIAGYMGGQGAEQERALTDAARERAGSAGVATDIGAAIALPVGMANRGATLLGRFGTAGVTGAPGVLARTGLAGVEGAGYGALTAMGNDRDVSSGALTGAAFGLGGGLVGEGIQGIANMRSQAAQVPTIDALKQEAGSLYKQAEARGVVADALMTNKLADNVKKIARDNELIGPKGRVSEAYPRAREAMNLVDEYAGEVMNPTQMQVIRDTLADARNATEGKERRIASLMLKEFDDFTSPLAPELEQARKISQRYIKAGQLENMRELGDIRAGQFTNSGPENAMRTEYRQLDRAIAKGQEAGWSPAEREAIAAVSRGTPAQTAARNIGKLAPTGPVSFIGGAGVPFLVGNAFGGPAVGAASAGVASALGYGGKAAANALQSRNIQIAELLARSGGQLPVVTDRVISDAVARALIGGGNNQMVGQ